ncbi:element excision factor XisH family protein [Fibrisoma montanum]|uniref:element excision factor XisH family protein n=1 Tax=Fibrisoma montanum TaxID=2305895 RepID=UPI0018F2932D
MQKDGWQITHDPYYLKAPRTDSQIDSGAEKLIGAQRDKEYIAVEVKSVIGPSCVVRVPLSQQLENKTAPAPLITYPQQTT